MQACSISSKHMQYWQLALHVPSILFVWGAGVFRYFVVPSRSSYLLVDYEADVTR